MTTKPMHEPGPKLSTDVHAAVGIASTPRQGHEGFKFASARECRLPFGKPILAMKFLRVDVLTSMNG